MRYDIPLLIETIYNYLLLNSSLSIGTNAIIIFLINKHINIIAQEIIPNNTISTNGLLDNTGTKQLNLNRRK